VCHPHYCHISSVSISSVSTCLYSLEFRWFLSKPHFKADMSCHLCVFISISIFAFLSRVCWSHVFLPFHPHFQPFTTKSLQKDTQAHMLHMLESSDMPLLTAYNTRYNFCKLKRSLDSFLYFFRVYTFI